MRPFSNFQFLEKNSFYTCVSSLKRLFSLARSKNCCSAVIEDIKPQGALLSEIVCLENQNVENVVLQRISFWNCEITSKEDINSVSSENLQGYLIFKSDKNNKDEVRGHVFEAVFRKYDHKHNFVPHNKYFNVVVSDNEFTIDGVMYCQQNGQNKACAQVALRSLLCGIYPDNDFSYEEIQAASDSNDTPSNGLNSSGIRAILDYYNVNYFDLDYHNSSIDPQKYPYDKWLYSGIECGFGALVGFALDGPSAHGEQHIIPFFGHTFNQDTWAPRAGNAYFKVGANTQYFSSEEWLSSFIGHDDNFGPDFCVPRRFLKSDQVKYVVSLMPNGVEYDGVVAEVLAIDSLYSTLHNLSQGVDCFWFKQLRAYTSQEDIVLRASVMFKDEYIKHLNNVLDWDNNIEDKEAVVLIKKILPDLIWLVEVSIPELFSTNYSKIGDIILDASMSISDDLSNRGEAFIMARFPRNYYINNGNGKTFRHLISSLESHVPVIGV